MLLRKRLGFDVKRFISELKKSPCSSSNVYSRKPQVPSNRSSEDRLIQSVHTACLRSDAISNLYAYHCEREPGNE
jgi:hypothetical protein